MTTRIPICYGPRAEKNVFDVDAFKYDLWEGIFLGYLRIQHLLQILLAPTDQSHDMEKNGTVFAELIHFGR